MFQTKDFLSITAALVNRLRSTTRLLSDFNVGSRTRVLLEAPAQEIDQLYQQMLAGLLEAIPVSVYTSFGFDPLPAQTASGTVHVVLTAQSTDTVVSANTRVTVVGAMVGYLVVTDTTIAAGATSADIAVIADVTGSGGNLAAEQAWTFDPAIPGVTSASNVSALVNGRDDETADQRKARFNDFISTIARGTVPAVKYALRSAALTDAMGNITEQAKLVAVIEPWIADHGQPIGLVLCYVHNGAGSTSSGLVARAQEIVDGYYDTAGTAVPGYRAAGVVCTVAAAAETAVPVAAAVTTDPAYVRADVLVAVEAAISAYLSGLGIGVAVLRADLIALAMGVPGVLNFVLTSPASDVTIASDHKPMPSTFTLT